MRSLAVLLLALSVSGSADPPPLTYRTMMATRAYMELPGTLGITYCQGSTPRSLDAQEIMTERWRLLHEVERAHEGKHRDDRAVMGCQTYDESLRDPANRIRGEVRAFCAGARKGVQNGWYVDGSEALMDAAMSLSGGYNYGLTIQTAYIRLLGECGGLIVTGS